MSAARQVNKIFVSNLPWTINSGELMKYFSDYGYVSLARVIFDKDTGLSKGFGYVSFGTSGGLEAALKQERHVIEGHHVIIQPAE